MTRAQCWAWIFAASFTLLWFVQHAAALEKGTQLMTEQPRCEFSLYNNPTVRGEAFNPAKGEKVEMDGYPSIQVRLRGLPAGEAVKVAAEVKDSTGAKIFSGAGTAAVEGGLAQCEVRLDKSLVKPATWSASIKQGARQWNFGGLVVLHKLYGRITDFDGKPLSAFLCANGNHPGAVVQANKDGEYVFFLPEAYYPAFFVADTDYADRTLEVWVYDYRPKGDLKLDLRIGQLEVYELHAWRGVAGLKLDFIPQSVGLINRALRVTKTVEPGQARDTFCGIMFGSSEGKPYLSKEDITAELGVTPLTIQGFWERQEALDTAAAAMGVKSTRPPLSSRIHAAAIRSSRPGCPGESASIANHAYQTPRGG